ncbi:MAG: OmpW family outer membrane protein [Pseudomonadota bacterium]
MLHQKTVNFKPEYSSIANTRIANTGIASIGKGSNALHLSLALLASSALSVMTAGSAHADQGDFQLRLRGIIVAPTEESSAVLPSFPDAEVGVTNGFSPEIDLSYFITNNIAAELIAATTAHDIVGEGSLAGLEIAETMVLPPTLTFQYHFTPNGPIRPYVGVGVNFTAFYSTDSTDALNNAIGTTDTDLDNSFGVAFQAGVDIPINDRWFVNADVKYIDIDTTATLTTGNLVNTVDVNLDPIVAGIGIGVRF